MKSSGTSGVVAVDPPATSRDFFHNRRLRVEGVRLQYDNDPARIADAGMAANGVQWFLKSGPLAPCKLQYWVNPTVLQWPTDLSLTIDGTLLTTLADREALAYARGRHPAHSGTTTLSAAIAARDHLFVEHIVKNGSAWA